MATPSRKEEAAFPPPLESLILTHIFAEGLDTPVAIDEFVDRLR